MTLDNDGFAGIVLLVLAGALILDVVWSWFRNR